MESTERIKNIESRLKKWNFKVSFISLWGPAVLLLIEIITQLFGKCIHSTISSWLPPKLFYLLSQLFSWLSPKLIISFILFAVIVKALFELFNLNAQNLMEHDETIIEVPRKLKHIYGLTAYKAVQKDVNYAKNVDLLLDNGLEMLSQKLFSSLITLTTIIVLTDSKENSTKLASCLSFFIITTVLYVISFYHISSMSNSKKRKLSEYFLLVLCSTYNILAAVCFLFLLLTIAVPYPGGLKFFIAIYVISALAFTIMMFCTYRFEFIKIDKLKKYLESSEGMNLD